MSQAGSRTTLSDAVNEAVDTASGKAHRDDPVLPRTGGPAGNGQLTAWLGLTLLVLFIAELATLLDVRHFITWHLAIGLLLVPPALAKTATTGWRMLRYYAGAEPYLRSGPPPLLLRLLGPLVVLGTLALLGTGVLLIILGPESGRQGLVTVVGHEISPLTLHQASFLGWAAVTGLHVLGRLVPAARLSVIRTSHRLPGTGSRMGVLLLTGAVAAVLAVAVLTVSTSWTNGTEGRSGRAHEQIDGSAR